jgi:hypothetical protein
MRNHVAKSVWQPKFRQRVVVSRKQYTRKKKHKKSVDV